MSTQYGIVTGGALNLRKAPSTRAARWNNVWPRGRIALVKPAVAGWYETLYRGDAAFVSAAYLTPLSAPAVPDSIVARMRSAYPALAALAPALTDAERCYIR